MVLIWKLAMPFEGKGCNVIYCFTVERRERNAIKVRKAVEEEHIKQIMSVEFQQTFVSVL
jgi:hypothetical protein